jgi:hypothetical protein
VPTTVPLVYLPRGVDNSTGGQCFVDSDRWGVPRGALLSLSWGTGTSDAAFAGNAGRRGAGGSGAATGRISQWDHRGRFNPKDGQLYVSGCQGWGSYTPDDGCFQRLRWTGAPAQLPIEFHAHDNGVLVRFPHTLDMGVKEAKRHFAQVWNYRYSASYGSPEFSVRWPEHAGTRSIEIKSAHVLCRWDAHSSSNPRNSNRRTNSICTLRLCGSPLDMFATLHKLGRPFTDFPGYQPIAKHVHTVNAIGGRTTEPNPVDAGSAGRAVRIETGERTDLRDETLSPCARANASR